MKCNTLVSIGLSYLLMACSAQNKRYTSCGPGGSPMAVLGQAQSAIKAFEAMEKQGLGPRITAGAYLVSERFVNQNGGVTSEKFHCSASLSWDQPQDLGKIRITTSDHCLNLFASKTLELQVYLKNGFFKIPIEIPLHSFYKKLREESDKLPDSDSKAILSLFSSNDFEALGALNCRRQYLETKTNLPPALRTQQTEYDSKKVGKPAIFAKCYTVDDVASYNANVTNIDSNSRSVLGELKEKYENDLQSRNLGTTISSINNQTDGMILTKTRWKILLTLDELHQCDSQSTGCSSTAQDGVQSSGSAQKTAKIAIRYLQPFFEAKSLFEIKLPEVNFQANQDIIKLIEDKDTLLKRLNEEQMSWEAIVNSIYDRITSEARGKPFLLSLLARKKSEQNYSPIWLGLDQPIMTHEQYIAELKSGKPLRPVLVSNKKYRSLTIVDTGKVYESEQGDSGSLLTSARSIAYSTLSTVNGEKTNSLVGFPVANGKLENTEDSVIPPPRKNNPGGDASVGRTTTTVVIQPNSSASTAVQPKPATNSQPEVKPGVNAPATTSREPLKPIEPASREVSQDDSLPAAGTQVAANQPTSTDATSPHSSSDASVDRSGTEQKVASANVTCLVDDFDQPASPVEALVDSVTQTLGK